MALQLWLQGQIGTHFPLIIPDVLGCQPHIFDISKVGDETSMPGRLEELNKTYGTQCRGWTVSDFPKGFFLAEFFQGRRVEIIHQTI